VNASVNQTTKWPAKRAPKIGKIKMERILDSRKTLEEDRQIGRKYGFGGLQERCPTVRFPPLA
jgi:hypothetical protein